MFQLSFVVCWGEKRENDGMKSNQNFHNRMKNRCCCFVIVMLCVMMLCAFTQGQNQNMCDILQKLQQYLTNKGKYFCALSTKHKRR